MELHERSCAAIARALAPNSHSIAYEDFRASALSRESSGRRSDAASDASPGGSPAPRRAAGGGGSSASRDAAAAAARDAARDDGEALEQLGPLLQTLFDGHEALRAAVGAARAAAPAPPPPSLGEVAEEYSESGIALQAYEEF